MHDYVIQLKALWYTTHYCNLICCEYRHHYICTLTLVQKHLKFQSAKITVNMSIYNVYTNAPLLTFTATSVHQFNVNNYVYHTQLITCFHLWKNVYMYSNIYSSKPSRLLGNLMLMQ